ncbi:MAG TPA: GMC family oxidoreductase [Solirubrobacterales bacterium]|nr:GMC family oxidoreductase [Solirubrobacterales bacterium]
MAPGVGPLPAAEREIPVVDSFARYAATLEPRTLRLIRLALRAFEWLPFPWRFSRASLDARERFLSDMERSRWSLRRDLLLLMKVLVGAHYGRDERVRAAVGYEERCEIAGDGRPEDPGDAVLDPRDLEPAVEDEECDVVVVGSGAGGAVAAAILAAAGLDVIVLEAGPYMTRDTYPDDPVEALSALYRDGGLTIAEGRPAVPVPVGRAVGGTTVINSGTALRAPERVLAKWRREHGIRWATELEAEFADAEKRLRVMPVDVERMGRNGQLFMAGAEELGISGGPLKRNAGRCVQCSSCPKGCRLDAKRAMHVTYLPRAAEAGARVRSKTEVERILFEGVRAVGVRCRVDGGERSPTREVRARGAVVCAGGALGTPELLLRSGFDDGGRRLGTNLHVHPAAWIGARFEDEVRGWDGVMQSYYVDEWFDRGLLLEATFTPLAFGAQWLPGVGREHQERMLAYDRIASTGVHLSDRSSGRVALSGDGSLRLSYKLSRDEAATLTYGIARAAEIFFAAGATEVYPQVSGAPVIRPGGIADFEAAPPRPSELRLEAFHPMGTAAMGADASRAVTTPDGAVRGARGLFVADASLLPTSLGVNPMMTVIACASRVATRLAERLSG